MARIPKIAAAALALIVAGCSSSSTTPVPSATSASPGTPSTAAASVSPTPSEPVSLSFWIESTSPSEQKMWQAAIDRYHAKNPNVTVKMTVLAFEDMMRNMPLALDAGTAPDIASVPALTQGTDRYVAAGKLVDLTEAAKSGGWLDHFSPDVISYNNPTTPGRVFGIPWSLNTVGVFYNADAFAKEGLAVPTSIADFETVLQTLKDRGYKPVVSVGAREGWPLSHIFEQLLHTGTPFADIQKLVALDPSGRWGAPTIVQAAAKVLDWTNKGFLDKNMLATNYTDASNLFISGKAPVNITGTWQLGDYSTLPKFKVGFFNTPQMDPSLPWHAGGFAPYDNLVIPKGKNEAAATDFLAYLLSEENMTEFWNAGTIVSYKFATVPPAPTQVQSDVYSAMQSTLPGYYMDVPNAQVGNTLWANLQSLVGHHMTPEEALAGVQKVYDQEAAKKAASPSPSS